MRHIRASVSEDCQNASMRNSCSRLDFYNSMLTEICDDNLNKWQRVQNTFARIVTGANRRDHIMPVPAKLHWLTIRASVTFEIGTMVYTLHNSHPPSYLNVKLKDYTPVRALRCADMSAISLLAESSPAPMSAIVRRASSYCAVKPWNNLPDDIRKSPRLETFENHLKKHLYQQSVCS